MYVVNKNQSNHRDIRLLQLVAFTFCHRSDSSASFLVFLRRNSRHSSLSISSRIRRIGLLRAVNSTSNPRPLFQNNSIETAPGLSKKSTAVAPICLVTYLFYLYLLHCRLLLNFHCCNNVYKIFTTLVSNVCTIKRKTRVYF